MAEEDWQRHYDTLFWTVTTIFAAAIGGLFVYVDSKPNLLLSVAGFILIIIATYFGISFRQLRHAYKGLAKAHWPQWPMYVFLNWGLGSLWISLIAEHASTPMFNLAILLVGVLWTGTMIFVSAEFWKKTCCKQCPDISRQNNPAGDEQHEQDKDATA